MYYRMYLDFLLFILNSFWARSTQILLSELCNIFTYPVDIFTNHTLKFPALWLFSSSPNNSEFFLTI